MSLPTLFVAFYVLKSGFVSQPDPPDSLNYAPPPLRVRRLSNRHLKSLKLTTQSSGSSVSPHTLGLGRGLEAKCPHSLQNLLGTERG